MSESQSIDEGWEESLDSDQVTHVKGDAIPAAALSGEWLVNTADQVVVPMTTNEVIEALRARRITDRSLVWRLGMRDWSPLAEVPPLRLAAGRFATPAAGTPAQPGPAKPSAKIAKPAAATASTRSLHPPPKEAARAARDERRRNTLPFGFPVVRDPATIREPAGLHASTPRADAPPPGSSSEDSNANALAVYERAAPSLTFADSVRAEWEGTNKIVHQHAPSTPPVAPVKPITLTRAEPKFEPRPQPKAEPQPKIEPKPRLSLEPQSDPKPRLSLEPQSDPKPRLSLEPQSDPLQSAPVQPLKIGKMLPPGGSLAPTTTDPRLELPQRGAGMWGDLSVVLASDLRAAKASSKRITLVASLGSALLASVLTLWFAHSATHSAREHAPAAQPQAEVAPPKSEISATPAATAAVAPSVGAAPSVRAAPSASAKATPPPATASAHLAHAPVATAHAAPTPAPARVAVIPKPKPAPAVGTDDDSESVPSADANPYADQPVHKESKTPTAAFKETSDAAEGSGESKPAPTNSAPNPPAPPSGLEDGARPVRPAPTAAPGF